MRIIKLTLIMMLVLLPGFIYGDDTGTYEIQSYNVHITPKSDGMVNITYTQQWKVTSGHIPWITIGTANTNYTITDFDHAVIKEAKNDSGDGWQGIRLDLIKDYQVGEVFTVTCTISQNKLFWADEQNYHLELTPGWYDNAPIHSLRVTVKFFVPLKSVTSDPRPNEQHEEELIWVRAGLTNGTKFPLAITFPKNLFGANMNQDNLTWHIDPGTVLIIIVVIVLIFILLLIISEGFRDFVGEVLDAMTSGGSGGYSGGSISSGGSFGGGGGFGGRGGSSSCACVSCACACACAGGGGAGCSHKTTHSCSHCQNRIKYTRERKVASWLNYLKRFLP